MVLSIQLTAPNGVSYAQPTGLFINNEFVPAVAGKTLATVNPYDESTIAEVASAGPEDVDIAVVAARKAFNSLEWRGLNIKRDLGDILVYSYFNITVGTTLRPLTASDIR
ncbi:hypothetical protein P175DRAFT_0533423 [Aspergillus ochraceoroseus IBT 24754]|uniref:Aldehyde dehydrogenase domain-containing protein n=3 Tax=Aspergillus subgen. Nidulantes TaxID=2720870 RepID=A0A0F8X9U6_9EURO|nr:uncharacterized protein P175DRAFT_0533423 [Aspergillus ochraceoroseus IBT 24754]KKK24541.1 hypothetical protein AOCH_001617 [Aspergillus ochraceoroseus]KKK26325.1 hypothetical protein ARAM_001575 [Aspergillus rambellii]PTU20415.1 hypothetical protein P175DRAFT_0533423 [Aspergillus ochraceoroseus IBT 24754]